MALCRDETFGPVVAVTRGARTRTRPSRGPTTRRSGSTRRSGPGTSAAAGASPRASAPGRSASTRRTPRPGAPPARRWAACKDSGLGRRHGRDGILKYTEPQTVAVQRLHGFAPPPSVSYDTWARGFSVALRALKARSRRTMSDGQRLRRRGGRLRASAGRSPRCGWPRRATGCWCSRPAGGSPTTSSPARRGTCGASCGRRGWAASASSASTGCPTSRSSPGAGVGGGSLVYANTLYRPDEAFYDDPQWRDITDWRAELAPAYDLASRMLGVTQNPTITPSDVAMRDGRRPDGRRAHLRADAGRGVLRRRAGRHRAGPVLRRRRPGPHRLHPVRRVHDRLPARREEHPGEELPLPRRAAGRARCGRSRPCRGLREVPGGWQVETERTGAWFPRRTRDTVTAAQVVLAAGTWGTQRLLHRMRDAGRLPHLSPRLGELTRTNSESLVGALSRRRDVDFTRGVAITSSFRPAPDTHVEPVRYGRGSNAMGLLSVTLTDGDGPRPRWLTWLADQLRAPGRVPAHALGPALVGADDHRAGHAVGRQLAGRVRPPAARPVDADQPAGARHAEPDLDPGRQRGRPPARRGHRRRPGRERRRPARLDDDRALPRRRARSAPTATRGVVDGWHRVFGHPGLHVVDGAAVSANLGANPSLTITAQAERAMSFWPVRGEPDPRPPLGSPYRRVDPVPASTPAVRGMTLT